MNDRLRTGADKGANVHWTGKLKDGRVVTDSRAENSEGRASTFNVGSGDMFKCWELAIQ
jgi:FKBP-type peptidyl-prolyl cis-trans isomerase